jgi:hypothetical protein
MSGKILPCFSYLTFIARTKRFNNYNKLNADDTDAVQRG